jgi:hypothetical protein
MAVLYVEGTSKSPSGREDVRGKMKVERCEPYKNKGLIAECNYAKKPSPRKKLQTCGADGELV